MENPNVYVFRAVSADVIGHHATFDTQESAKATLRAWWPKGDKLTHFRPVGNFGGFRAYYDGVFQGTVSHVNDTE